MLQVQESVAELDLLHPDRGLAVRPLGQTPGGSWTVSVLGVAAGLVASRSAGNPQEAFLRGDDLIASYPEAPGRPFSLRIYWRAVDVPGALLAVDVVVSLETPQLESFPDILTQSRLPGGPVWLVGGRGGSTTPVAQGKVNSTAETLALGLLLRPTAADWSYLEISPPEDQAQWQWSRHAEDGWVLRRQMGGSFLEKGVLRKLRVRGAFLPRTADLELATASLEQLAAAKLPLTT